MLEDFRSTLSQFTMVDLKRSCEYHAALKVPQLPSEYRFLKATFQSAEFSVCVNISHRCFMRAGHYLHPCLYIIKVPSEYYNTRKK